MNNVEIKIKNVNGSVNRRYYSLVDAYIYLFLYSCDNLIVIVKCNDEVSFKFQGDTRKVLKEMASKFTLVDKLFKKMPQYFIGNHFN